MTRFMRSIDEGAEAPLHWATIPAVSPSGAYADGTTVTAPAEIATPELAADLWRHSEGVGELIWRRIRRDLANTPRSGLVSRHRRRKASTWYWRSPARARASTPSVVPTPSD